MEISKNVIVVLLLAVVVVSFVGTWIIMDGLSSYKPVKQTTPVKSDNTLAQGKVQMTYVKGFEEATGKISLNIIK